MTAIAQPPDPEFERLLEYIRDERGFDFTGYKRPSLIRRIEKRMDGRRRARVRGVPGAARA